MCGNGEVNGQLRQRHGAFIMNPHFNAIGTRHHARGLTLRVTKFNGCDARLSASSSIGAGTEVAAGICETARVVPQCLSLGAVEIHTPMMEDDAARAEILDGCCTMADEEHCASAF